MSTEPAFDRLVEALERFGSRVQLRGDRAEAQCPAHEDGTESLGVRRVDDGVLVLCRAGCDTRDVMAKLGMGMRDLYDNDYGIIRQRDRLLGVARYKYQDGRLVTRGYTPDGKKSFVQKNAKPSAVLYRLDKVLAAVDAHEKILLVEGEKDVHSAEALGATATSAPQGAANWPHVDASPLYGATIIAVVDRGEAGQKWALQVRTSPGRESEFEVRPRQGGQ